MWKDNIEMDLPEMGLSSMDWIQMIQGRVGPMNLPVQ
jgi:hypothetical protein